MFYYEVVPADRTFHGHGFLTYHWNDELDIGQIVVVKLRTKTITGFVVKQVSKPAFPTKTIDNVILGATLPPAHIALFEWLTAYYPGPQGAAASLFIPQALDTKKLPEIASILAVQPSLLELPKLTTEQQEVLHSIQSSKAQTHLMHGDTGTGKTRLYIELAKEVVKQGKSVVILVPEIALTSQMIKSFSDSFSHVHLTHSGVSDAQRREIWRTLASTDTSQIVIGPRSALFMPLKNIGLVVVDEFHEGSYKQDQEPRYHAVRAASTLARLNEAKFVLGSATPPIDDYFYASKKQVPLHRLTQKPTQSVTTDTTKYVVDLSKSEELSAHRLLSKTLIRELTHSLERGEQALLFLNKRGSARLLLCQSCGWRAECSRCNIPYTYHQDSHSLRCHTCGKSEPAPNNCPSCRSENIIFKSPGTKAIVESLERLFPKAKIARFDKDNKKHESFDAHSAAVQSGDIDILVGTQLLAKGHDLPKLSLVGILLAENELQFPDFSSEERSYQLLHQLAGRVGRGHKAGTIVLQTYNSESSTIGAIEHKKNGWLEFYESQLKQRQAYGFPPYFYLLKIEVARANEKSAQASSQKIADEIAAKSGRVVIVGPAPAFIAKRNNRWYWHLVVKAKDRSILIGIVNSLPKNCTYELDPTHLL